MPRAESRRGLGGGAGVRDVYGAGRAFKAANQRNAPAMSETGFGAGERGTDGLGLTKEPTPAPIPRSARVHLRHGARRECFDAVKAAHADRRRATCYRRDFSTDSASH